MYTLSEGKIYYIHDESIGWVVGIYLGVGFNNSSYQFKVLSSEKSYFSNSFASMYWGRLIIKMLPEIKELAVNDLPLYLHGYVTEHMENILKGISL